MAKNGHVHAICCRSEDAGDVISSRNLKSIDGYMSLNFEVSSSNSFRDFSKRSSCDGKVDGGSGGVNAICIRPEVGDDVIFG